ncbi:hypothetical protein ONS95_000205 [Cadophora gregata]|uniref:uncharacterized protein n=1 Tax=Cadophora gregata TaxID=51156 RepID=UPI0026DD2039|nr:uncharacterized protein ONS95_000205 [Cadophora gregata]KAK0115517.1 hypothetical protein ONS96_013970 [Cadophora gregata f. sp. sojae]KAK0128227.1 hypothetical protein ONS95_000205 [Cadophora gregata]
MSASRPAPIIFNARGTRPDVRLRVFDTEFHVSSTILRLYSAHFLKAFGWPGPETQSSGNSGAFKYEWDTIVEEDGDWVLVSASTIDPKKNHPEALKGEKEVHIRVLNSLLCAMYREPFMIASVNELQQLTKIADYYDALAALSHSILQPLVEDRLDIEGDAVLLVHIALKLRHKILFREAVLFLAGNWDDTAFESYIELLEPKVQKVVKAEREAIGLKVAQAFEFLTSIRSQVWIVSQQLSRLEQDSEATVPNVFSEIYHYFEEVDEDAFAVKEKLEQLMANNVALHVGSGSAGEKSHRNHFLCSRVPDEDLPWDDKKDF